MKRRSSPRPVWAAWRSPLVVVVALGVYGCRPLGVAGDSCKEAPCAAGLKCVDEVCIVVPPPPPPVPPCVEDRECVLNGSADGRVCVDGVCEFADCAFDFQCGVRICDDGKCANRTPCFADTDCGAGKVCAQDNVCRTACKTDNDCPAVGGFSLSACVDGECLQRCLNDVMCFGGICEANLCVPPECAVDEECSGLGSYFCDGGRCTQFTPCEIDDDCFDLNFFCNDLGRCEERAACRVDAECGSDLCIDRHCRPATPCATDECPGSLECVAGRCVSPAECRADADCGAQVCDNGRCRAPPAAAAPAVMALSTGHGVCLAGGGACDVVVFAGDSFDVRLQGYNAAGDPVLASVTATGALAVALVDGGRAARISTSNAGVFAVDIGGVVLTVHVAEATAGAALEVLVVDGGSGAPVVGADVFAGTEVGVTDALGRAAFLVEPSGDAVVGARALDGRGVALLGAPRSGRLRLPLAPIAADDVAGFRARVNGTGDEPGDVGFALALPMTPRAQDASLAALFGQSFPGALELPVFGAVQIALPAAVIVDANVPLIGAQEVKGEALQTAPPGPAHLLAFEGRYAQGELFGVAFGVDEVELALDMAARAEGMDARLAPLGVLRARPRVVDGRDVDGDGDTQELVPDYDAFTSVEVFPEVEPPLRVGVRASAPPGTANNRMIVACGVESAAGFVPLGVAVAFGTPSGSRGEQVRLVPPPFALGGARACAAHAVFADGSDSVVVGRGGFRALLELGALLDPPSGAVILDGVPAPDRSSVLLRAPAGADALRIAVFDGGTTWDVIAPARGTVALPPFIAPVALAGVTAYRLGGDLLNSFTSTTPLRALDDVASAISFAP